MTSMDPWFLHQMKQITDEIKAVGAASRSKGDRGRSAAAKRMGISDERLAAAGD
jgi:carbamoyl-phosphate synthase large subunit